jgi:hypothetical protein
MNPAMLEAEVRRLLRPARGSVSELHTHAEAGAEQSPLEFTNEPLMTDLQAGVLKDNSVLRGRARGQAPMPPRRGFAESVARRKHLLTPPVLGTKPLTGMAGKHWRG